MTMTMTEIYEEILRDGGMTPSKKIKDTSIRFPNKIAMRYKGYGLPMNEIISEGNVGLMQAVKKFEPEKGFTQIEKKKYRLI